MKIGWLADRLLVGGTEMSCDTFKAAAPDWVTEIVDCRAQVRPPQDVDLFIVESCVTYLERWTDVLHNKPVICRISDQWPFGSCVLKRWLLNTAHLLIFNSPMHCEQFHYRFSAPYCLIPPPVDLEKFRQAAQKARVGNVYVGRVEVAKGAHMAIDWALRTGEPLRMYGKEQPGYIMWRELPERITYCGEVPYAKMPALLGSARRFVFFPIGLESFGRVVAEAWAAGCELVVEGDIGATWWIENKPGAIEHAPQLFWREIRDAIA